MFIFTNNLLYNTGKLLYNDAVWGKIPKKNKLIFAAKQQ